MAPTPPASLASFWLGIWSRPPDRPSQVALGVAAALLAVAVIPGGPSWVAATFETASLGDLTRRRRFLTVASFAAAFLSLGYIALYLRGGPRAPEAASYWLQGRALSHGALSWTPPEPTASFRSRFLWYAAPDRLAGVFPPGFALLLAPVFLVGAPMLVGPLVAASLLLASWALAREIALDAGASADRAEAVGRIAVGLSLASAALRYHSADILPYGAVGAVTAASLACALRGRRKNDPRLLGMAGLLVGFLIATQPRAAIPAGVLAAVLALGFASERRRALTWALACALPGVLLVLAANRAATGRAFLSATDSYFTWVEPPAPSSAASAIGLAVRRLREHLLDVANFEPLALVALVPVLGRARSRAAGLAGLLVAGHLILCAFLPATDTPPPIGAPLLAGAVPVEHGLIAVGLWRLFPRSLGQATAGALALSLAGFAVHASYEHMRAAIGGFGRPRYEPDITREASITHGLLFFDDDAGYEIATEPGVPPSHGVQAARLRNDDHDRLLYDSMGHPAVHRYSLSGAGASVVLWTPQGAGNDTWRFEAEADWPPYRLARGRAEEFDSPNPCASDGRVLLVTPDDGAEATVTLAIPAPRGATPAERRMWNVIPRVLQRNGPGTGSISLLTDLQGAPVAEWTWSDSAVGPTCAELPPHPVELGGDRARAWLVVRAKGGPVALDKTTLRPVR